MKSLKEIQDKQEARPETGNEESLGLTEKLADLNLEEKKELGSDDKVSEVSIPSQ